MNDDELKAKKRAYQQEWRRKHPDKVREYTIKRKSSPKHKAYRAKWNKFYSARWKSQHPGYNKNYWKTVFKPKSPAYYAKNKDRILKRTKQWQKQNRHKIREYRRRPENRMKESERQKRARLRDPSKSRIRNNFYNSIRKIGGAKTLRFLRMSNAAKVIAELSKAQCQKPA